MTHPHELGEGEVGLEPIPVVLVHSEIAPVEQEAPESSEWMTWQLNGNEAAFRVLPNNKKRAQAVILVGPGVAGNVNGYVMFGSPNKVSNNKGGILRSGQSVTIKGAPEVWCVPDGANSLWVTIVDERYS